MSTFVKTRALGYDCVTDEWTGLYWCPEKPNGFQLQGGQTIALGSFAAFGEDQVNAEKNRQAWLARARAAWSELYQ